MNYLKIVIVIMAALIAGCPSKEIKEDKPPAELPMAASMGQPCAGFAGIGCQENLECYLTPEQQKMDDAEGVCRRIHAKVGETCGSMANIPCDEAGFCKFDDPEMLDGSGVCEERPKLCPDIAMKGGVCGNDGKNYPTECHANMVGVSINPAGGC